MRFLIALIFGSLLALSDKNPSAEMGDPSEREIVRSIIKRVDAEDYSAFGEVPKLSPAAATAFLYRYFDGGDYDPRQTRAALIALKSLPGAIEHLQDKLLRANKLDSIDLDALKILSLIADGKAAAVVAPFIFDTTNLPAQGDVMGMNTSWMALYALGDMHLADAPAVGKPILFEKVDLFAWQQWAIEHHFVPEDWKSRVGIDPSEATSEWKVSQKLPTNWRAEMIGKTNPKLDAAVDPSDDGSRPADKIESPERKIHSKENPITESRLEIKTESSRWWVTGLLAVAGAVLLVWFRNRK